MRWLAVTVGLLAATGALLAGIYVRDRNPNAWHPPAQQLARGDAEGVLLGIMGWHCPHGCRVETVTPLAQGRWFARLEVHWRAVCVEIEPRRFSIAPRTLTGFTGVLFSGCETRPA